MTVLAAAADRSVLPLTQSSKSRQALAASVRPFQGSAMGVTPAGYHRTLTAGDIFAGFAERTLDANDVVASDGGQMAWLDMGIALVELPVSGVARDDIGHRRIVWATDDGTFGFTPTATMIGPVVGVAGTNLAIVLAIPDRFMTPGVGARGVATLADAAVTLTTAHLDKILLVPNSAARTVTLPAVADCAGRFLTFKKTHAAAAAITLDANSTELIDAAETFAAMDAQYDTVTIYSDGAAWHIVAKMIA